MRAGRMRVGVTTRALLDALKRNLRRKAEACGDEAICELFLMNNVDYIQSRIFP